MNDYRIFKVQVTVYGPKGRRSDYAFFSAKTASEAIARAKDVAARKWKNSISIEAEIVLA